MLTLENLKVRYKNVEAVAGVSLTVETGEVITLIGPNGAGKSTTLKAISGLVPSAGGRILFNGQEITRMKPHAIARLGIAHVPEGRHLFGPLSVTDNLMLGAYGRAPADQKRSMDRVFEIFPRLHERRTQKSSTLSGGEQQMLAIGRAMMSEPRLLILDEPSLGLAPKMVELIFRTLQRLRSAGQTILLVEQNANLALEYAGRFYLLNVGKVVLSGLTSEVRSQTDLVNAYLGGHSA